MSQSPTDFAYPDSTSGPAVAVCAPAAMVAELAEDLPLAGLSLGPVINLADLAKGTAGQTRAFVHLDQVGGAELATLMQCDTRFSRDRTRVVVSTTFQALDGVFGCLERSSVAYLVDATRPQRAMALTDLAAEPAAVREYDVGDRETLLQLAHTVADIAARIEALGPPGNDMGLRLGSPADAYRQAQSEPTSHRPRTPLPDPRLVRAMIARRQARSKYLPAALFADPAWDMLLDLTAARAEHARVSVTSLCIASGVPPTTALRWISQLSEAGLLERQEDPDDRRRAFIALTDRAADAMARYFAEAAGALARTVLS